MARFLLCLREVIYVYNIGDVIPLFCKFTNENVDVYPELAEVRVLHEHADSVYEDLPWTLMERFDDGYVYSFNTFELVDQGHYVTLFRAVHDGKMLKITDGFDVKLRNVESSNATLLYGFVVELTSAKPLENVDVVVDDLVDGQQVYQAKTDVDGRWEASVVPGNYSFKFSLEGCSTRNVRAQVGDHGGDVQFNTVSLERDLPEEIGSGLHEVSDVFTGKGDLGLVGLSVEVYLTTNLSAPVAATTTDTKGRWRVFLDTGSYVVRVTMNSGVIRRFSMIVDGPGEPKLTQISSNLTTVTPAVVSGGSGSVEVKDVILDAHGSGVNDATVTAYLVGAGDARVLVASAKTSAVGEFTLHLDPGRYMLTVTAENFKAKEQFVNV